MGRETREIIIIRYVADKITRRVAIFRRASEVCLEGVSDERDRFRR